MAAPRPPRTSVAQRVSPAEDTKMQHDRLQAEAKAVQQTRKGEIAMASAFMQADDQDGVWDGQSGELVESGMSEEEQDALARYHQLVEDADGITEPVKMQQRLTPVEGAIGPLGTPIYSSEEDPDEIIETVHQAEIVPDLPKVGVGTRDIKTAIPVKRSEPMEIIRLNATVTPTIGKDNTWDFQEGRRYRVPRYVAIHLHEKGLISQWG